MSSRRCASGCSAQARPWTMRRTRRTRRTRRMVHRMLRRAARGGGARRRWRVGRAARRWCCRRGFTRRRRRSPSQRRSARSGRRRRRRARAWRRVRWRAERSALVASQLAATAAWDARLRVWATPRTPEGLSPAAPKWRHMAPPSACAKAGPRPPARPQVPCYGRSSAGSSSCWARCAACPPPRHSHARWAAIHDTSRCTCTSTCTLHAHAHAHAYAYAPVTRHVHAHAHVHVQYMDMCMCHMSCACMLCMFVFVFVFMFMCMFMCRLGGRLPSHL